MCVRTTLLLPILWGLVVVMGQDLSHFFTLRSQLDSSILKALNEAEKEFSEDVLTDSGAQRLSSTRVMDLKPLYFHLGDLAIHVTDLRLTSSEPAMTLARPDLLAHRMTPEVTLKWAQVDGKIKTGLDNKPSQKFEFRLVQSSLQGQGVVGLTVDLANLTWASFTFKPNSSSVELKVIPEAADPSILKVLNSSTFGELLSKKLQRDINFQLTNVASTKIREALEKTSKLSSLEPYAEEISEIGINNTENANTFIDNILKVGGAMIRSKHNDRIRIPDIQETFAEKYLITVRGSFRASQGSARGTSSVYRVGDVIFGYDNGSLLHFYGTLGFEALHLYYEHYKAEVWGVGPSGSLDTSLAPLSTLVHVHLNTSSKMVTLDKFKITNVGELSVELTGLGGWVDWLVSRVTSWVVGMYRDQIIQQLESSYEQYGQEIFSTYSIEELLNGGRDENYVVK